jgi:hypothetical protein
MLAILVCTLLATTPIADARHHRVDVVEVNHLYNDMGEHVLDQVIFWDWCFNAGRYQVRDWRLLRGASSPSGRVCYGPQRLWPFSWQVTLLDDGGVRRIYARAVRETWTQYDPEMAERNVLEEQKRRKLR